MSSIEEILSENKTHRVERDMPSVGEIEALERLIGQSLPTEYIDFLHLKGLEDLRFSNEILAPCEIAENLRFVRELDLIPFASNGCGDLFCWNARELQQGAVVLWEHKESNVKEVFGSFRRALRAWRF